MTAIDRKYAKVVISSWWENVDKNLPIMTKDELSLFSTRFLLLSRPHGLSTMDKKKYIYFWSGWDISKKHGIPQNHEFAVNIGDYIEILSERPHIPNKKESKAIRKAKIKKGK